MAAEARAGMELAGYRIEELIARGGMGVVYRAEDTRLGRKVALKVIAPELVNSPGFKERFQREARLAASIDHPHVLPVYEADEHDGLVFLVSRFVEGTDLRAEIDRTGRLEPGRALLLLGQIAGALDAAHARDLVHRDVKPANILIAPPLRREQVEHAYLTDFGIARQTKSRHEITQTGSFVGTIEYAAPEQIEGKDLDGRADQYSLGCILYQVLCGEVPFRRQGDLAVLLAHLHDRPAPPSKVRPGFPGALDAVLGRALAKKPDDRFDSCYSLIASARDALGPVSATAVDVAVASRRPPRRPWRSRQTAPEGVAHEVLPPPGRPANTEIDIEPTTAFLPSAQPPRDRPRVRPAQPSLRPSRRRLLITLVAACALAGAGIAAAIVAQRGDGQSTERDATTEQATTATTAADSITEPASAAAPPAADPPAAEPTPAEEQPAQPLPVTTFEGEWFSVSYPVGWNVTDAEEDRGSYYDTTIRNRSNDSTFIRVDVQPNFPNSAVNADSLRATISQLPGYREIRYDRVAFKNDSSALWWEWIARDKEGGPRLHKIDLFFIRVRTSYAILTQAPARDWRDLQATFKKAQASLSPSPVETATAGRAENLAVTADVRPALRQAVLLAYPAYAPSQIGQALQGSVYYARLNGVYWAIATFRFPDVGTFDQPEIFRRQSDGDWQDLGPSYGTVCPPTMPAAVLDVWKLRQLGDGCYAAPS